VVRWKLLPASSPLITSAEFLSDCSNFLRKFLYGIIKGFCDAARHGITPGEKVAVSL